MISAFRIDPVASGRRLCDIDKVTDYSELLSHVSENGKSCQSENIPIILEIKKKTSYRYISVVPGLPNFSTRDRHVTDSPTASFNLLMFTQAKLHS